MLRSILGLVALVSALFAAAMVLVSPAVADERTCAPREEIVKLLTDRYGEVPSGRGLSESGDAAFEMFRSRTGTWTITMTTTNGLTCVMAAGKDWRDREEVARLPRL